MIKGNTTAGYGETQDAFGRKIVTEFRQCSHCQAMWAYIKGVSFGRKVSMCTYCMGLLCEFCTKTKWNMVDNKCVPYSEGFNDSKYYLDENLGIFLRK